MRANRNDPESDLFWFQSINSYRMAGLVARMAASYSCFLDISSDCG